MGELIRVLVIEDSEDDAELARIALENSGYDIDLVRVETEDRFLLELRGGSWDLVLSDFSMPAFNGFRAFELLRESGLDIPFVFVSGALGEEHAVRAMRAGARDYVPKGNLARLGPAVQRELAAAKVRAEQRRAEDQLRQSQKMEAIGRLAGGVAHDFNNILTAIFTYAGFVREELPDSSPTRQDIDELLAAADRAKHLTRQLLAFSRQQPVTPEPVDPNHAVDELQRMLGRLLGEDIAVRTAPGAQGNVYIDRTALDQVLLNLAVNARDAMPNGGNLTFETANVDLDEEYARAHKVQIATGPYIVLSVSDTGVGIDAATRARIFEPFFTTKSKGKGTGLGLATCYGIVKQANGHIWVYSEPGIGTTFKVYLPRVDSPVQLKQQHKPPVELRGNEHVLVAEDDPQVRASIRRTLSRLGYHVTVARDGKDALAVCRARGRFDLLLTDVVMPGINGRQLAESALQAQHDLRVVYMSGYTANAIADRGIIEQGAHLLNKPFTSEELACKVRHVLEAS